MSRGEQLFNAILDRRFEHPIDSAERIYAQTIGTACMVVERDRLYWLLEEAERTGKRLALVENLAVLGSPYDVILV